MRPVLPVPCKSAVLLIVKEFDHAVGQSNGLFQILGLQGGFV